MKRDMRMVLMVVLVTAFVLWCSPASAHQPQHDRGWNSASERQGYEDGLRYGQHDRSVGKPSRPTDSQAYNDADRGYSSRFGSKDQYKADYRRGYVRGYQEGYGGRGAYGDDRRNRGEDWPHDDRDRNDRHDRGYRSAGERQGYEDGLRYGQHDRSAGKPFRPTDSQAYNDANRGYSSRFGSKDQYKADYRRGYVRGYEEAYGRGNRH